MMHKIILILSSVFLLVACEKNTYVYFQFKNVSDSPIVVNGHDLVHNWAIQDTILVGEEKNIAMWSKFGKDLTYFSPVDFFGDDLLVVNAQGDTLKKDYKDFNNWQPTIDEDRAVATHNYLFEIQEADFN
jgi:hypothetical protein